MTTQVKQLRCAAYSRVSTDRQNPLSVEDQLRKCRQFAEHERWRVLEEHIYSDTAISGTTDNRPGLQRLLAALKQRPCPFDILLVDDTSRLSRKAKDTLTIYERLNFAGVRLVAISQGIDSENEQAEVLMQVHGMVDSLYVKELATKTRRGMEGAFRRGMHAGGRCFGYRNVPIEDPSRRDEHGRPVILGVLLEVNEEQAAITVVSGRWLKRQDVVYGCPLNANRGSAVCSNNVRIRRYVLETQMLAGLQEKVLHPEVIEYTLQRFEETLTEQMAGLDSELEQMRRRKASLENEIRRLTDRIATGDPSPSIMAAILDRERELSRIADRLLECRPDSLRVRLRDIRKFVETRMKDLRCLLNFDPVTVRSEIAKHVRHIVLTPEGKTYRATGTWDLLGCGSMDGAGGQS